MLTIDGSRFPGSGAVVRQAVAFSALGGRPIRAVNVRAKREKPGVRAQHLRVIEAVAELVNGQTEGLVQGAREFVFRPGSLKVGRSHHPQHVVLPLLRPMGLQAEIEIVRPGYVPRGEGVPQLSVQPRGGPLRAIVQDEAGPVTRVWGIALSSHLERRQVSRWMAEAAHAVLA